MAARCPPWVLVAGRGGSGWSLSSRPDGDGATSVCRCRLLRRSRVERCCVPCGWTVRPARCGRPGRWCGGRVLLRSGAGLAAAGRIGRLSSCCLSSCCCTRAGRAGRELAAGGTAGAGRWWSSWWWWSWSVGGRPVPGAGRRRGLVVVSRGRGAGACQARLPAMLAARRRASASRRLRWRCRSLVTLAARSWNCSTVARESGKPA